MAVLRETFVAKKKRVESDAIERNGDDDEVVEFKNRLPAFRGIGDLMAAAKTVQLENNEGKYTVVAIDINNFSVYCQMAVMFILDCCCF